MGFQTRQTRRGQLHFKRRFIRSLTRCLILMRELQVQGNIELGYVQEQKKISGTALTAQITSEDLVNAAKNGYRFEQVDGQIHLEQTVRTPKVRRVEPSDPEQFSYLSELLGSDLMAEEGVKISIEPRSLLGAMYYLSHVISVPREHYEAGLVPVTVDALNQPFDWTQVAGNLFRVCVQKRKPKSSYVAIEYKGYWYYIPVTQTFLTPRGEVCLIGLPEFPRKLVEAIAIGDQPHGRHWSGGLQNPSSRFIHL